MSPRALVALLFLASVGVGLSSAFHQVILDGIPHVQDELNYLWQARIFEQLELTAPRPPVDEVFLYTFQKTLGDRVYSIFPPGWPLVLAVGGWLGLRSLWPMLLGGATVLMMFGLARALTRETDGDRHATPETPHTDTPLPPLELTPLETRLLPWLVAMLAVLSPAQGVMAGTYMPHTLCLLLATTFWWAWLRLKRVHTGIIRSPRRYAPPPLIRGARGDLLPADYRLLAPEPKPKPNEQPPQSTDPTKRTRYGLLAGLCCGMLVLTRPVDALATCAPALGWLAWNVLKRRTSIRSALPVLAPILLLTLGLLWHNQTLTGRPLTFPQNLYFATPPDGRAASSTDVSSAAVPPAAQTLPPQSFERFTETCNSMGLGPDKGCLVTYGSFGHTPQKALRNAWENLLAFDRNLLGGHGAFLLVLPGLYRLRKRMGLMWASMLLFPFLYSLYWYHGIAYGARFWHPLVAPALLGVASTLAWITSMLHSRLPTIRPALLCLGLLALLEARAIPYHRQLLEEYGNRYWCVDNHLLNTVTPLISTPALVLMGHTGIELQPMPLSSQPGGDIQCGNLLRGGSGILHNDPNLLNPLLFGYLPPQKAGLEQVLASFPDRSVYLYIHDTLPGPNGKGHEEVLKVTPEGLVPLMSRELPATGVRSSDVRKMYRME